MSIFEVALESFIDMNHELVLLSKQIDWEAVESDLESIRTVALYMCDTTLLSRTDTATVCLYVDDAGYIQGSIKGAAYIKDCVYWYGNSTYAEILCDVSVEREDSLAFPDMLDGPYRRKIIKTLN